MTKEGVGVSKKKVEAILFAVGKEISTERVASLCELDAKKTEKLIKELQSDYASQDNSLQITQKENSWKLTVEDQFIPLVSSIVSSTELERPLMDTLAVIAWRYPVVQSEVIKLRSAAAYEHMKALMEQGFIAKEKFGRTFKIKLTPKFFAYFDLPSAEAKDAFLKQIPEEILREAEEINKEIDEAERLAAEQEKTEESESAIKEAMGKVE